MVVGSVADSYDNAMSEAPNGILKTEPIEMWDPEKVSARSSGLSSRRSRGKTKNVSTPPQLDYVPTVEYRHCRTTGGFRK